MNQFVLFNIHMEVRFSLINLIEIMWDYNLYGCFIQVFVVLFKMMWRLVAFMLNLCICWVNLFVFSFIWFCYIICAKLEHIRTLWKTYILNEKGTLIFKFLSIYCNIKPTYKTVSIILNAMYIDHEWIYYFVIGNQNKRPPPPTPCNNKLCPWNPTGTQLVYIHSQ